MDIRTTVNNGTTIVYFIGRLDITVAHEIENTIENLIDEYPENNLLFNL